MIDFPQLARLAGGYVEARILQVAVRLGLFDVLKERDQDGPSVARSLQTDPRATELLLNALAALGLLEKKGRLFSLTEPSLIYLVSSSPKYFGGMVLFDASLWDCWGDLETAIRRGKAVRSADMYQADPRETELFISAMHSLVEARGDAEFLTEKLDLEKVTDLLDIGSGPGTYPIHFCRRYPNLRATIFDLPGTLKVTERFIRGSGLEERIKLIAGDYRADPIPGRYQLVFLSNIIHAESGDENSRLMAKLYSSLDHGGKIVIKDHILDDSLTRPAVGAIFSLLMLLATEAGRCYSFREVKGWLEQAGFQRITEAALPSPLISSLVMGEKD